MIGNGGTGTASTHRIGFKESLGADFRRFRRSGKGSRESPALLPLVSAVAVLMSAMYLYKVFAYMPQAIDDNDLIRVSVALGLIVLFFMMFVRFVIAIFRLFSGSRRAWVTTVRMAITYLVLLAVGMSGFQSVSSDIELGIVTIPWWAMSAVMCALIVYMFLPSVRAFFTPAYAEPVGPFSWALYILALDPFRKGRMKV